jgi:hypothetical protein
MSRSVRGSLRDGDAIREQLGVLQRLDAVRFRGHLLGRQRQSFSPTEDSLGNPCHKVVDVRTQARRRSRSYSAKYGVER